MRLSVLLCAAVPRSLRTMLVARRSMQHVLPRVPQLDARYVAVWACTALHRGHLQAMSWHALPMLCCIPARRLWCRQVWRLLRRLMQRPWLYCIVRRCIATWLRPIVRHRLAAWLRHAFCQRLATWLVLRAQRAHGS